MRRFLVFLACCSTPPAPVGGHAAPQSRRDLVGYPHVAEPATVDCAFAGPWEAGQPRELRVGDGGPVYATVFRPHQARLELAGTSAFVELEVDGFRIWGHVDRGAVVLHPARAFVMAGYLLPGSHAVLRPIAARPREVTVEITPPKFARPIAPPRDARPCNHLGLAQVDFDPTSALGDGPHDGHKLPANVPVPLAASAGAPVVAELRFDEEPYVGVIERRGDQARILVDDYYDPEAGTQVGGWVAQSLLVRVGGFGHPGNWSTGAGPPGSSGLSRAKRHVRCTHDVPLVIDLGGKRYLAGVIQPDTKFGLDEPLGDSIAITLDRIGLQLAPSARPLVRQTAVADCTDVPR